MQSARRRQQPIRAGALGSLTAAPLSQTNSRLEVGKDTGYPNGNDSQTKFNQEKHADHIDVILGICDPQLRLGEYVWLALIASMALSILRYGSNGSLVRQWFRAAQCERYRKGKQWNRIKIKV